MNESINKNKINVCVRMFVYFSPNIAELALVKFVVGSWSQKLSGKFISCMFRASTTASLHEA